MMKKRVMVLMGGPSFEHEVSLTSGQAIYNALLKSDTYEPFKVTIDKKGHFQEPEFYKNYDFVFIALHGPFGEDGTIQGFLEILNLPYSGAGVLASAIAMNKEITRRVLMAENIPTVPTLFYDKKDFRKCKNEIVKEVEGRFGFPCVVKTPISGSSIGVYLVDNKNELEEGINLSLEFGDRFMVEEYMTFGYKEGGELECGVLGNEEPRALSLCEFIPRKRYYDYEAKYTDGLTDFYIPARLPLTKIKEAQEISIRAYNAINCEGFARVDMYIKKDDIFVGEINTIPGFTSTSVFPMLARQEGIGFTELVEEIIKLGFESFARKKIYKSNFLKYPSKT
ncbi:MAG: D-alanine--D-alanine ligase A [candidate division WS2 bacterium]|nr:D-alanine--D-alanine ligase A [Candidatus Lithacetigena glycinireducens]